MTVFKRWKSELTIGQIIILTAFFVIICFSWLLWFFLAKYVDTTNFENREMAVKPDLTLDSYAKFAEEYETYFNDSIPFRNNLITLNNSIDYFIFQKSTNDRVIIGKNNWLFYGDIKDGDPIGCYQGTNLLSEEELRDIADNCVNQRDFLAALGKEFVILILPNKERIYSEMMPDRYGRPADNYRALQIINYLRENTDLRVVYPYDELMSAKEESGLNIWYKTDTHWNWVGGYIGACALLNELGIEMPAIDNEQIEIVRGAETSGDLAGMLNLSEQLKFADTDYSIIGYDTHQMEGIAWDFNNAIIYRSYNADERKIYVCRDSFSSHMSNYIGSQFNDSYFRHRNTYSYDDFVAQDPDIFVYETVERYVHELSDFSIQKQ